MSPGPASAAMAGSIARTTQGPSSPIAPHATASRSIGATIATPGSCACSACGLRPSPRNTIPYAFEKHAAASPPISPSAPITAIAGTATALPSPDTALYPPR